MCWQCMCVTSLWTVFIKQMLGWLVRAGLRSQLCTRPMKVGQVVETRSKYLFRGNFEGRNNEFLAIYLSEHVLFEVGFINSDSELAQAKMRDTAPWFIHEIKLCIASYLAGNSIARDLFPFCGSKKNQV